MGCCADKSEPGFSGLKDVQDFRNLSVVAFDGMHIEINSVISCE